MAVNQSSQHLKDFEHLLFPRVSQTGHLVSKMKQKGELLVLFAARKTIKEMDLIQFQAIQRQLDDRFRSTNLTFSYQHCE